jgi:hypothetical protein
MKDGWIDKIDGQMDRHIGGQTYGQMYIHVYKDSKKDRWTDGQMNR